MPLIVGQTIQVLSSKFIHKPVITGIDIAMIYKEIYIDLPVTDVLLLSQIHYLSNYLYPGTVQSLDLSYLGHNQSVKEIHQAVG